MQERPHLGSSPKSSHHLDWRSWTTSCAMSYAERTKSNPVFSSCPTDILSPDSSMLFLTPRFTIMALFCVAGSTIEDGVGLHHVVHLPFVYARVRIMLRTGYSSYLNRNHFHLPRQALRIVSCPTPDVLPKTTHVNQNPVHRQTSNVKLTSE